VTSPGPRRRLWIDAAALLLLFGVGASARLGRLGAALVNGDSVGPYWKAATILAGGGLVPRSHAPESGPALYWATLPFVAAADSLEDAYAARFVAQALVAPLVYVAVRAATAGAPGAASRVGALLAGAAFAFSVGLRQTLESGYQGYLSIELAAVITAAFALSLRRPGFATLGLVAVPLAMMCHPFAAAYLPGAVVASVVLAWRGPARTRGPLAVAAVVAVGLGFLRLRQLAAPAFDSGSFDPAALAAIPAGNRTGAGAVETVLGSLRGIPHHDGAGWLLPLVGLAAVGLWSVRRRELRAPASAAVAVAATLAAIGAAIGYLQPYHWRIAAPAVVVAVAVAGVRALPALPEWAPAVPALLIAARLAAPWGPPIEGPSDLDRHAALAGLTTVPGAGGWVEFGTVGDRMWGSPVAVRLDARLRRGPPPAARAPLHLVLAGPPDDLERLAALHAGGVTAVTTLPGGPQTALLVLRMDDPRASEAWTERACAAVPRLRIERRAIDYLNFEQPELSEPYISMWFDACTGANVGW